MSGEVICANAPPMVFVLLRLIVVSSFSEGTPKPVPRREGAKGRAVEEEPPKEEPRFPWPFHRGGAGAGRLLLSLGFIVDVDVDDESVSTLLSVRFKLF